MKKTIFYFSFLFILGGFMISCDQNDTPGEKLEEAGEDIKDGMEDVGDDIKDATN